MELKTCERSRECCRPAEWQIVGGKVSCTTHLGKMVKDHGGASVVIQRIEVER